MSSPHNMSVSNTGRHGRPSRSAASAASALIRNTFASTRKSGLGKGMKMNVESKSSRRTVKKGFTSKKHKLISRAKRAEEIRARRTQRAAYIRNMLRGRRRTQKVRNAKEEKKRLAELRESALAASAAAAASAAPLGNSHMPSSAHPFQASFKELEEAAHEIRVPRRTRTKAASAASSTNIGKLARGESNSNDDY